MTITIFCLETEDTPPWRELMPQYGVLLCAFASAGGHNRRIDFKVKFQERDWRKESGFRVFMKSSIICFESVVL